MATAKLLRRFLFSTPPLFPRLTSQQGANARLRLHYSNGYMGFRQFGVLNDFSNKLKGEAHRNKEFQNSVKEFKEKAEELKGMTDELKERTKKTTEQLYKQVDGVWTEAGATAKKVSSNVKEKLSSATEEVKESFGIGKQESSDSERTSAKSGADAHQESFGSSGTSDKHGTDGNDGQKASSNGEAHEQTGSTDETFFKNFKSKIPSSKVSSAFQKLKEANLTDFVKQGYEIVKDELTGKPTGRKHLEYTPPSFSGEISTKTDVVVMQTKQSRWSKEWEAFKGKVRGHRLFKRFSGISEPVVTKSQEIAEDMRERWETSDNPIVHKIQDLGDTILQETDAASSIKEIRRRDPSFSLLDFAVEVQDAIRPVLNAYMKGDIETLKNFCSPEVISRCEAEHKAFKSHGIFFDNKILHVSDVEVRETKMMGTSPIIIFAFQTQQVHCVRDQNGEITEGGKDTIHTVYYAWAMQQVEAEDVGKGAIYPIWRLREMQQLGVQALI